MIKVIDGRPTIKQPYSKLIMFPSLDGSLERFYEATSEKNLKAMINAMESHGITSRATFEAQSSQVKRKYITAGCTLR